MLSSFFFDLYQFREDDGYTSKWMTERKLATYCLIQQAVAAFNPEGTNNIEVSPVIDPYQFELSSMPSLTPTLNAAVKRSRYKSDRFLPI